MLNRHFARGQAAPEELPMPAEDLARLSWLLGIDPSSADARDQRLVDAVEAGLSVQLSRETLAATAQAYARGLGRIVAAEADNVRRLVAELPRAERAPFVDEALTTILEPAESFLGALHHVMLRDALRDALTAESLAEPVGPRRVVGLVDLCSSTDYLRQVGRDGTHRMVDALFDAGTAATTERSVWAVKYMGDGVFLMGRNADEVVAACFHALGILEAELPMSARAGLADGPVVRRAGDYFGLVVNLSERVAAAADPGLVLATEEVAAQLSPSAVDERRLVEMRGFDRPVSVAVLKRG